MSTSSKQFSLDPNSQKGNLGDYRHASRVFVNNNLALAPKAKFLYHVAFNTNPLVLQTRAFDKKTVSVLVKNAELPKFQVRTDTLNQYNRKKNTQTAIDYQPVQIRFHDDNSNIVGDMWQAYFKYYYADSTTGAIPGSYIRNAMENSLLGTFAKYGYDNGSYARFFNSITISDIASTTCFPLALLCLIVDAILLFFDVCLFLIITTGKYPFILSFTTSDSFPTLFL